MNNNEVTNAALKVLSELVRASGADWDQVYLRFHSEDPSHRSLELMSRKGRKLSVLIGEEEHEDLLETLLLNLFDGMSQETGTRPLIAVLTTDKEGISNTTFDYHNARAYEIDLLNLGRPESYYVKNEVDVPENIRKFQEDLNGKGITEMPVPFLTSKTSNS